MPFINCSIVKNLFYALVLLILTVQCDNSSSFQTQPIESQKKNIVSAKLENKGYMGKETCISCHQDVWHTFQHTGMGRSWRAATLQHSDGKFGAESTIYDSLQDIYYQPFTRNDSLYLREFKIDQNDTIFKRIQQLDEIVGSGQHTNSHLVYQHQFLTQAPATFYTQDSIWSLPPGFEKANTRFARIIGKECVACHNAYVTPVAGGDNVYSSLENGIDCERCHGPGKQHVSAVKETPYNGDPKIIHPGKLSRDLLFDLCSRCHLQGNTVLAEGQTYQDFLPGTYLDSVLTVFLPEYEDDQAFIMASHADRLKKSACFQKSESLSCVTCHNPHVSVKSTDPSVLSSSCISCHKEPQHTISTTQESTFSKSSCISCHMPNSSSVDIPHVSITDHWIQIPRDYESKKSTRSEQNFIDLRAVNARGETNPITWVKAYLKQYESFTPYDVLLKKANNILKSLPFDTAVEEWIHWAYLAEESIDLSLAKQELLKKPIQIPTNPWKENTLAWSWYRFAQLQKRANIAYSVTKISYENAILCAPLILDIRVDFARYALEFSDIQTAQKQLLFCKNTNPAFEALYTPLGYSFALQGDLKRAEEMYAHAIKISPIDAYAHCNLAGVYVQQMRYEEAEKLLIPWVEKEHPLALQMYRSLKAILQE